MKRSLFVLAVLLGSAFLACGSAFAWGSISGEVYDETTQEPLAGKYVHAYDEPGGTVIEWAQTDSLGNYTLYELEQGLYYVWVYGGENCASEWWEDTPHSEEADPIEVHDGEEVQHINFGLVCELDYGCIVGRVTDDETGEPINDAYVRVYTDPFGDPVAQSFTGWDGYYEICELEQGIYFVHAHAQGCEGEWWNNQCCPGEADTVEVQAGQITDHIDFALECEHPTGCITGRVTDDETGEPINDAFVRVYTDPLGDPVANAFTGINGHYEICDLEQGIYFVHAHAQGCEGEWWENKFDPEEADTVEVHAGQTTDHIDFALGCEHPGTGCIVGRVTDEGTGEPINDAYVRVYTDPFGDPVAQSFTGWDGYYEICDLEQGIYFVHAHAQNCEGEWWNNQCCPGEADTVEVHAGQTTDHIDFSLDCGPQNLCIWGRVVDDESGEGINDALVMAMMLDTSYAQYTFTNQHGHYEICELITGEYVVFAHAGGYIGEFYDNVYRWEHATPVTPPEDGIDFSLGERYHDNKMIRGKVFDGVDPVPGALVYAYSENAALEQVPVSSAMTQEDGSYAIPGLSSGTYTVTASHVGDPTTNYPVPVIIKNGDVNGIDVYLGATRVEEGVVRRTGLRGMFLSATPNPFRDRIRFSYDIPVTSMVKLQIFDLSGRLVKTIVNETLGHGVYSAEWTPGNLPSGLYISRLSCGEVSLAQKVVLAR